VIDFDFDEKIRGRQGKCTLKLLKKVIVATKKYMLLSSVVKFYAIKHNIEKYCDEVPCSPILSNTYC
jgi:hypothetical protein